MEKIKYEAPLAQDLSGLGASGQGPLYTCEAGFIANADPGDNCWAGGAANASCSQGAFFTAEPPGCVSGSAAAGEECVSGGSADFQQCLSGAGLS